MGLSPPSHFSYRTKGLDLAAVSSLQESINQPGEGRAVRQGSTRRQQRAGLRGLPGSGLGSAQVTSRAGRLSQALSLETEGLAFMGCVTKLKL